jgi:flagellar biosynthesis protein FlhF
MAVAPPQPQIACAGDAIAHSVVAEIKTLRTMLEEQLAALSWSDAGRRDPTKTKLLRALLDSGFSPALGRRILEKLPAGREFEQALKWVQTALALNLRAATERDTLVEQGGVYALVGPTGVGKTTTAAKLAARCVVKHGADKLALLTTDTYRIGGHEQLRMYGRLLGVTVQAVKDAEDLRVALHELRGKRMVLIDTAGVGQRDHLVAEQELMLKGGGAEVQRIILLNATCSGGTLDDVARAFHAETAHGCIVTKVDEAMHMGVVIDAVIRRGLKLHYIANGQKVPEDLHLADPQQLLQSALRPESGNSPFSLTDEQLPYVAAGLAGVGGAATSSVGALKLKTGGARG